MSHFSALVLLPPTDALADTLTSALEPFADDGADPDRIGQWEHWIPGGRYAGHFHPPAANLDDPRLLRTQPARDAVAGGPLHLLDLLQARAQARRWAANRHAGFLARSQHLPTGAPWRSFLTRHRAAPEALPLHRAEQQFTQQPQAAQARKALHPRLLVDLDAALALDTDAFAERHARRALPATAMVDLNGNWSIDPAFTDRVNCTEEESSAYIEECNDRLDAAPTDTIAVCVEITR
ncbi:hypothetical protein BIV57_13420 [Mangrovactinospora gilvigrisea]|uniref:Uncharacterized protein n=1 Tax=Mangrovactinospora gilvigrisea TaxID=1428644 RepID=A0A1J7BEC3_9ACTN|nr:hypothetical protein [Mangrovactinospora gilvigrisea]OIV36982.1 hypothetical protein BIV57_13420 [Mangrovactinospora gilvigrisea]